MFTFFCVFPVSLYTQVLSLCNSPGLWQWFQFYRTMLCSFPQSSIPSLRGRSHLWHCICSDFFKPFFWTSLSSQITHGTHYLPAHKKTFSNPPHSHVMSLMCLLKSKHVIFPHAHRPPCHANDYETEIKTINIFCLSLSYHHLHKVHTNQPQIRAPAQDSTLKLA